MVRAVHRAVHAQFSCPRVWSRDPFGAAAALLDFEISWLLKLELEAIPELCRWHHHCIELRLNAQRRSLLWLTLRAQHHCAPTLSRAPVTAPSPSRRRHRPRAAAPRAAWRSAARCRASAAPRPRAAPVPLLKDPAQLVRIFQSWTSPQNGKVLVLATTQK